MKACATNTSDIRGHHDFKRVVIAKGGHCFRRFHGSERMGNPTMRISCSRSMRRAQGTLRGRGTRETQAVDKKGGHLSYSWISLQHDVMSTQQRGPSYPGSVKQASPPPSLFKRAGSRASHTWSLWHITQMFRLQNGKDYLGSWFQKLLPTIPCSLHLQGCGMTASHNTKCILEGSCLPRDGQELRKRSIDRDKKPLLISYC